MIKVFALSITTGLLVGCASGSGSYSHPLGTGVVENSIVIQQPRHKVWDKAVANLGKEFFIINNMDRSSGFINLSYTGSPVNYVNCGNLDGSINGMEYSIPVVENKQFDLASNGILVKTVQSSSLEGRVNLILEDQGKSTKVTANTKYIVSRDVKMFIPMDGRNGHEVQTANFSTTTDGTLQPGVAVCRATGDLEGKILDLVQGK